MKTLTTLIATLSLIVLILPGYSQADFSYIEDFNQERILKNFTEISVYGNFNIYIFQVDQYDDCSLIIEANKGDTKNITTEVKNGTLQIYSTKTDSRHIMADIFINVKDIESIRTFGRVNIETVTNITIDYIDLNLSEFSKCWLFVDSPKFTCNVKGHGFAEISGEMDQTVINVSEKAQVDLEVVASNVECNLDDFARLSIVGSSKIDHSRVIDATMFNQNETPMKKSFLKNSEVCFYVTRN